MLIAQANGIVIAAVTVFQRERTLLRRERAKKLYSVSAYFLGKTISDMTNNVIMPMLYCMIVYWTAGYRATFAAYAKFILTFYLTFSTAQSMGTYKCFWLVVSTCFGMVPPSRRKCIKLSLFHAHITPTHTLQHITQVS
jgi:ABC-type multidrug transport system permease subunit